MNIDIFISYHTSSSLHITEAIVNKLESNSIRCWYAPRNVVGEYAASIEKAINECKIFLVIINGEAAKSFDVKSEINLAVERIRKKEDIVIIPFKVSDDDFSGGLKYYLGQEHWIDATEPSILDRIEELVPRVSAILGLGAEGRVPISVSRYSLTSKIPPVREVFVGRTKQIENIRSFFESGQRVLFLEGIGGIGKSELAKQYALKYRNEYKTIVFASYSESLQVLVCDNDKIEISGLSAYPDETTGAYFNRKMKIFRSLTDKSTLIIVDNFDVDNDECLEEFIEGSCDIIFTSRNSHPGYSSMNVNVIDSRSELLKMFERYYGMPLSEDDIPYIEKMFRLVEYHTYAIELMANQMETSFLSGKELYEMLCSKTHPDDDYDSFKGRDGVDTAFGHIRKLFSLSGLDNTEREVLRELSLTGVSGIPASVYWEWSDKKSVKSKKKAVISLIKKSWVRRSISDNNQNLSLHPLVTEVVLSDSELHPDQNNCRSILSGISKYIYRAWFRPFNENLAVADCILFMEEYFKPFLFDKNDMEIYCAFCIMPNFLWQI